MYVQFVKKTYLNLSSPNRVLLVSLDPLDPLELPVVDSTSSANLFRRRLPIPSVEATTAPTTPT